MSAFSKCCQLCAIAGSASSIPLIPSINDNNVTAPLTKLTAGGGDKKEKIPEEITPEPTSIPEKALEQETKLDLVPTPPQKPKRTENPSAVVMQHAMQKIVREKGGGQVAGLGCFWIPDFPGVELFFCFDRGDSGISSYLFHYSWGTSGNINETLRKVLSMTPKSVQLEGEITKNLSPWLKSRLQWIHKFDSSTVKPSEHCKVVGDGMDFQLICNVPNNSQETPTWKKRVPKGQVENAKEELKKAV